MTNARARGEQLPLAAEQSSHFDDLATHNLTPAMFDQICTGAVTADTVDLLEQSQYSQRKLGLRALIEQLADNPESVGSLVEPEQAWQVLAAAERHNAEAFADVLLYPTVGVWLTRALHYTRRDRRSYGPWQELGYLNLIAAASAIRCRVSRVVRVPVWHGVITLPTVGQLRLPGDFPIGTADVHSWVDGDRIQVNGEAIPTSLFSPTRRHMTVRRGLRLEAWIEDLDPYRGFGAPQPPGQLDQPDIAEWRKLIDEAWDALTAWHPKQAHELSAGLRALVPIKSELGIAGASSPAAFGGIISSSNGSAIELAETLVHELQHSKLNAVLSLVPLVDDDGKQRFYAPWRDDPRPLTALLHGVYAFTGAVEFWLTQRDLLSNAELRHAEFSFAFRRRQLRSVMSPLAAADTLSRPGQRLVDTLARRLEACQHAAVPDNMSTIVDAMVADHYALWRHRWIRPDPSLVELLASAWISDTPAMPWSTGHDSINVGSRRPLPGHRRTLLRTRAIEPERFGKLVQQPDKLPGPTPRADAAFCAGDNDSATTNYQQRIRADPDGAHAWVGLGLTLRAKRETAPANALLEAPEVTLAVHRRVRALGGASPDPDAFARWISAGL